MTEPLAAFLNALDEGAARDALLRCCGCERWVDAMLVGRPFANDAALLETADAVWRGLTPADWLEAFTTHPRIGDRHAGGWSAEEQAGMGATTVAIIERMHLLNQRYEKRFGHVFLICASGRAAGELLGEMERRITNAPDLELREAAEELRKITRLRLQKLARS